MRTYQLDQAGRTDIGNVRSVNEDKLLAEGDLFIVADGMGGQGHGEVAADLVQTRSWRWSTWEIPGSTTCETQL